MHEPTSLLSHAFDPVEKAWKATKIGQIKRDAPPYEAIYHSRLCPNLDVTDIDP